VDQSPLRPAPRQWLEAFEAAEARAEAAALAARAEDRPFEGAVAGALLDCLPAGGRCFVGNSLAIRAVDGFGGVGRKRLRLHGNRGASGIDGNVATAAGIAAASGAPTGLLIGDQAALHDCGGFAALRGRPVVAVVMDNGGGGIFDHLPIAAGIEPALFERAWIAPPRLDFAGLAAAHGLGHRRPETVAALRAVLAEAFRAGGPWLVEVPIDRKHSREAFHRYFTATAI
jgi:2-succinyl-5-enolpyruvyl-6-hydroxy-3-cyclohexene-1-carboxylate synthase